MPFRYKLSCLSIPLHTWRRRVETELEIPPCFFLLAKPNLGGCGRAREQNQQMQI